MYLVPTCRVIDLADEGLCNRFMKYKVFNPEPPSTEDPTPQLSTKPSPPDGPRKDERVLMAYRK